MKTAAEHNKAWLGIVQHWIARECWSQKDFEEAHTEFIQQIQLDAIKEGMQRAAQECDKKVASWGIPASIAAVECREAINLISEKLTIKDL